jgi:hypothetical protein
MSHFIDDASSLKDYFANNGTIPKRLAGGAVNSSYFRLLEGPIAAIAGNVPERADACSAAILGYN